MLQLITDRLRLRPVEADDVADLEALIRDLQVSTFGQALPHPEQEGEVARWVAEQQAGWEAGSRYGFVVHTVEPPTFVGVVALKVKPTAATAELGYAIVPAAQGMGYATEAAREVLRFAFADLALKRVTACCLAGNASSRRVLGKLGFRLEAELQPDDPGESGSLALLFYGLNRDEYPSQG